MTSEIESLLGGLRGAARKQRAELVEWLLEQGFTTDQIRAAHAPALLPTGRTIGQDDDYVSTREIADTHGIDVELLQRVLHAIGLARVDDLDAAVYLRADGEAAAQTQRFLDAGLDPDDVVQVVRVLADGLSHAAEVMRYTSLAAVLETGGTELEIAKRSEALVSRLAPLLGPWIQGMLFMHLRNQLETEAVTTTELAAGSALPGARQVAVAFADLVGFTRLGEAVPPEELEQHANRLATQARDVAVPPVRFVKTIGDAVMFVCTDPAPLLDAVLKLVEAASRAAPEGNSLLLRAGVAAGDAVSRAGDWFGRPVNLASRVTGVARPGGVLVAAPVREAVGDTPGFSWSFAGSRHLKGIGGEVHLFRVRRGPCA